MSKLIKVFKGSTLNVISLIINLVAMFFLTPFMIKTLGDKIYGLWAIVGSITAYYFLLDFGTSQAISRFIARAVGNNDQKEINSVLSNSLFVFSIFSILSIIVTTIVIILIPHFLTGELVNIIRILVLILGIETAIVLPLKAYPGVLFANLDFHIISISEILKTLFRTILFYLILINNGGIISLGLISSSLNILIAVILVFIIKKRYPLLKVNKKLVKTKNVKKLFNFSKFIFITNIFDMIKFKVDSIVIAIFIGLPQVTIFSIGTKIVESFMNLILRVTGTLSPVFSQYEGISDFDSIRKTYILGIRVAFILSVFIGANIIIFGESFIFDWVGVNYLEAYAILAILTIAYIIELTQSIGYSVLRSINKHKIYSLFNAIEAVINLILSIILVKQFGLIGVALGTAIPMMINKLFIQPYFVCKYLNLRTKELLKNVIWLIIFMVSFFSLYYYLINFLIFPGKYLSYSNIIMFGMIETVILIPLLYLFLLKHEEKGYIHKLMGVKQNA